jgi:hypothetical protein
MRKGLKGSKGTYFIVNLIRALGYMKPGLNKGAGSGGRGEGIGT